MKKAAAPRLHKKATPVSVPVDAVVSHDEVAKLAYAFWEARGFQGGSAEEDWFRAEMQLRERASAATA